MDNRGGDIIGRVLVIEFHDNDTPVFDKILSVLRQDLEYDLFQIKDESVLLVCGLEIHFNLRKVYYNHKLIDLTAKEYALLCVLAINKGITLDYDRLYQTVWNEEPFGNTRNAITCHIGNLRRKIIQVAPDAQFEIRIIRSIGYRFDSIK